MFLNKLKKTIFTVIFMVTTNLNAIASQSKTNQDLKIEEAILAGGCFWGVESLFSKLDGVVKTEVGYTGGRVENPNYQLVSTGITGHAESVKISFDANKISYHNILKYFFSIHDPTQLDRQQNDIGSQYASIIFYLNEQQKSVALEVIKEAQDKKIFNSSIKTKVVEAKKFYPAEDYHQKYLQKNPQGYNCHYQRPHWVF